MFLFPETVTDMEDMTREQMVLQSVNDAYRSGNVMGFLGWGDERLIIQSRFCGGGEDHFFQYLLDKVLGFPNLVDLEADAEQGEPACFSFCCSCFPTISRPPCGRARSSSISAAGITTGT